MADRKYKKSKYITGPDSRMISGPVMLFEGEYSSAWALVLVEAGMNGRMLPS